MANLGPCDRCRYFTPPSPRTLGDLPRDLPANHGQCRQASPRVGYWEKRWPPVRADEGCGQFKPKEEADGVPDHHG